MGKPFLFHSIFLLFGAFILLFIIAPLIGLVISTSSAELFETAQNTEITESIWLTIWVSLISTLFFAVAAIPFSWLLARKNFRFRKLVLGIIDLPVVIPHSAAGIAILGLISRNTPLGKMGDMMGINFIGHPIGIGLAMSFVSVPFLINAARDGFTAVPERLEKAARNLGASPFRTFFAISLPLAWRNIVSGMIMMFARGMSEFGAVVIVAYHPMIAPVLIFELFNNFGLTYARPAALIFIVVSLIVFIFLRMLSKEDRSIPLFNSKDK